jgi:hypothetical protein
LRRPGGGRPAGTGSPPEAYGIGTIDGLSAIGWNQIGPELIPLVSGQSVLAGGALREQSGQVCAATYSAGVPVVGGCVVGCCGGDVDAREITAESPGTGALQGAVLLIGQTL